LFLTLPFLAHRRHSLAAKAALAWRRVERLRGRQNARLLRASLAALSAHASHQRSLRAAADAAAHRRAEACARLVLAAWRDMAHASLRAKQHQERVQRRRAAEALRLWRARAARTTALHAGRVRAEALLLQARTASAADALAVWRVQTQTALRAKAEAAAACESKRREAADARAVELAAAAACAEERLAAAVADRESLQQARLQPSDAFNARCLSSHRPPQTMPTLKA
jgi:hypothetical protein